MGLQKIVNHIRLLALYSRADFGKLRLLANE